MHALLLPLLAVISLQTALDARTSAAPGVGIAVGIIDHGAQRLYVSGSDGNGRPVDAHTLFEIGSVSKTFTATALAAMALRRQVALTDPIAKYLPKGVRAPNAGGRQISLLDLAEQRSGLPRLPTNMRGIAGDDPYADYSVADMYAFLNGYSLTRAPGSQYEYSNYAIGLLGQLLANRANTTYPRLLDAMVLQPLGMVDTKLVVTGAPNPDRLAVAHNAYGSAVPAWHFESVAPAGGVASSLSDMLKYLRCNLGQGPLAHACLFAQRPRAEGMPNHRIGLVWNLNARNGIVSHNGATNGSYAMIAISRDRQTGVVVMSNGAGVDDIATHVLVPSYPIGGCPSSVAAVKTDPASYAGVYCNALLGTTFTVDASPKANSLSIALLPQPSESYAQIARDSFYAAAYGAEFKFLRDGGNVVGLTLLQGGQTIPAARLAAEGKPLKALSQFVPHSMTLDRATLQQYVGTYAVVGLGAFTVTLHSDGLYVQLTGQPAAPVYASAKDQFFYEVVDARIDFERSSSGAVTALVLHQGGQEIRAPRTSP